MLRFMAAWLLSATLFGPTPVQSQGLVSGWVYQRRDAGFVPVPRARIKAVSPDGCTVAAIVADELGRYVITGLPQGPIVLRVSHPRFHSARSDWHQKGVAIQCPSSGRCGTVDFEMIPHGELAIELEIGVVDEVRRPIGSAAITFYTINEPGEAGFLTTKLHKRHRGSYRVRLPPGRYRIQVEPPRRQKGITYLGVTQDVLIEHSQEPKTVELVLRSIRTYEVSGTVLLSESQDAERMMVLLRPVQHALPDIQHRSARPARLGAPLNKRGRFVLHDVPPGCMRSS